MQNKGKWYLQWWGWIILVFSFIFATFGIPLIIDYIYMIGDRLQKSNTNFSASDLLSFYGSILSFLGTVALGILALYLNKKANDINAELLKQANESEKKSVLPYLTFNKYFTKYEGGYLNKRI